MSHSFFRTILTYFFWHFLSILFLEICYHFFSTEILKWVILSFVLFWGAVHVRWAGPATWASSARWGDFHPAFIWNFLSHCKKLVASLQKMVLTTWLLSGKFCIFNMDSNNFVKLEQLHFTVYRIMNMITAFSILLQLYGILLILVLLILDFAYLVVLVLASLKLNLERVPKHTHAL